MRFRGNRRRRWRRSWYNEYQRSQTPQSSRFGGIDGDVKKLFLNLDRTVLTRVFTKYEALYGDGKRDYAQRTYQKWRSGEVRMGGEICERLIGIVPIFLSFEQKFELVRKLWNGLRVKATVSLSISTEDDFDAALQRILSAIDAANAHEIPEAVMSRLEWLASDDAVASRELLAQVEAKEKQIACATLDSELRQLLHFANAHRDKRFFATRTVALAKAHVSIQIVCGTQQPIRSPRMPNEANDSGGKNPGELARSGDPKSRDLAPIQNPNDLLGEALRRMSPEKQEQIVGKATDEALRLQVKQKEGEIDHQMAASKVDSVADAARRLSSPDVQFEVRGEHRSEHGSVQVTVSSKQPSVRDRAGFCFVATACYGESHVAVVVLRRLRDRFLRRFAMGRGFINWYYKHSPRAARLICNSAVLRAAGRAVLWPIVLAASVLLAALPSLALENPPIGNGKRSSRG